MPTYEYRCKECGESLEVVQAFTDDPLTDCPSCSGTLRKVFNSVGISFKGSGFYKNDSRSSSSSSSSKATAAGSSDTSKADAGGTTSDSPAPSTTTATKTEAATG